MSKTWTHGWGRGLTGPTTPNVGGPTVAGKGWEFGVVSCRDETIAICPNQVDRATGVQIEGSGEEYARLIAAAPDLLEALKGILSNPGGRCSAEQWQAGLRAISKAEGRS